MSEWRQVPGAAGYSASDQGEIRGKSDRILRGGTRKDGYRSVWVRYDDGSLRQALVHHLVLLSFVGPRPDGRVTRHLNGDPSDNRLQNLAYGTQRENVQDALIHGTHFTPFKAKTHCSSGHELSDENTYTNPTTGKRACRVCRRRWVSEYRHRKASR